MMQQLLLADGSIKELAELVGDLPTGDVPAAWYLSIDPKVIQGYQKFLTEHKAWRDRLTELMETSGLSVDRIRYGGWGGGCLVGVYADVEPPLGWRKEKKGFLVPRKRTKAEKASEVSKRFKAVQKIPAAIDYVPGMSNSLTVDAGQGDGTSHVYWPQIRRPSNAVLAFWGANPDDTKYAFETDGSWERMKMSVYHVLRERQSAGEAADG
jgi:hypothetical protein